MNCDVTHHFKTGNKPMEKEKMEKYWSRFPDTYDKKWGQVYY
jgi:hypothetical protein